ncbi:FtsH protease activity modulator HflK [Actinobacillus seminis]|uniref:Protein HflK n=1 Tax=Actinobacillus seminis TaxID=722 RepID=A0A263HDN9_9PAST|nr:FtsH protease activity modulator HflK [Actinobacillus seminis]OZN25554.1 FtsH protease activity modulator HflK [Actinobacillus seminis]SUU37810.1 HflK protein [Actinobacillus seminis]
MSLNSSDQDPWSRPGSGQSKPENNQPKNDQKPSWSSSQDGSSSQGRKEQSPPDIEDVFNNLLRKLGCNKSGGQGNNGGSQGFNPTKLLPIVAIAGAIIWGVSGLYTVKEAERGVVTRFGQLHAIVQPGLNWKPTFVDRVIPINVEQVKELRTQGSMLTQDENMVRVEMTVQYRVQDPAKYLFSVTNANDSLNQATDSALRYVIGHMTMDDILTTGRAIVRENTWKALNEIIASYDMGLEVLDVNFQSARPPEEVKAAFDDAIKAQEDEQRYIREAEAYAREQEPRARGDAQRIVEEATAYKEQVVLNAQGEVERFQRLLPEFKAAPDLLRERLYIQTMEKVMANTPKVMLDESNGNNLTVLPLEQILRTKAAPKATLTAPQATSSRVQSAVNSRTISEVPASMEKPQTIEGRQGRFN